LVRDKNKKMIDQNTIDKIFDTADIVEIISEFVQLKKAGVNFKGLSPFSNEKTPSFIVSPAKGIYKDFSSGKGGNVVGFLMEHEKLSYPDALRYIAKKYSIEIIEKERSQDEVLKENERESLLVVSAFAQKYFSNNLKSAEGRAIGLKYLNERVIREDSIEKFQLGYSFIARDAFSNEAHKNGFKSDFLVKTGLSIEKNNSLFDRFSGRIIFPIHGLSGNVLGFGGRTLRSDKETAKYVNSPESEIYHKSKILYGLFFAKKAIVNSDKCFMVEGYTDVISMHQAGIENVVASSGTALTVEQIRLIKRFTQNITIIYDGDEAGIKASFRGIDLILEEGLNVRVVLLPDGDDPDSFSKKHNSSDFKDFIKAHEKDFINFKSEILIKDTLHDPVKKANLITDIIRSISVIPQGINRVVYIKECSNLLDVDEEILHSEVNKLRRKALESKWKTHASEWAPLDVPTQPVVPSFVEEIYSEFEEREIIYFLLKFGNEVLSLHAEGNVKITVAEYIIREIQNDNLEFKNLIYKKVFEIVRNLIERGETVAEKYFIYSEDSLIRELSVDMYTSRYELSKVWRRKDTFIDVPGENLGTEVPKSVLAYKSKIIIMALNELYKKINTADKNSDPQLISELQKQVINLNDIKITLSKALGERTIISFIAGF
jgi:DNA primase